MSATPKDLALVNGEAPRRVYVSFHQDPLVTGEPCFVGEVFLYDIDAKADARGDVFIYELVTDPASPAGKAVP